jgi:hypothetical protein
MFIYPICNHNWRNISTIYIYIYITRLASNEIFSPSNKIHREVARAKELSAPRYRCNVQRCMRIATPIIVFRSSPSLHSLFYKQTATTFQRDTHFYHKNRYRILRCCFLHKYSLIATQIYFNCAVFSKRSFGTLPSH